MNTRQSSWHSLLTCDAVNISGLLKHASNSLASSSAATPDAALDAEVLLCHVLQCNRTYLYTWPEKSVDAEQENQFKALVAERVRGTPVAYLTGRREFWSLDFAVTADTLIPRPETELLVETLLQKFKPETLTVLDLGTGSGAIAIALAHERPRWQITATDLSSAALKVAQANAERHQAKNLRLLQSNWFENLGAERFDVIVSNPPYIADSDPHLAQGDVRFEPRGALASGKHGLDDIHQLCAQVAQHLHPAGWFFCEHGYDQKTALRQCFEQNRFSDIVQLDDLAGQPRVTGGRIEQN